MKVKVIREIYDPITDEYVRTTGKLTYTAGRNVRRQGITNHRVKLHESMVEEEMDCNKDDSPLPEW
jgi:hypothetical protein